MRSQWRKMAGVVAAVILALTSLPCSADFPVTDLTDLWWDSAESGWGLNIAHQGNVLFLTFFVYGADGKPSWLSATADYAGQNSYVGDLYQTTGPYYGSVFAPAKVQRTLVGTVMFQADASDAGKVTYSVNGVQVTKPVQRQLLAYNLFDGSLLGGMVATDYNCAVSSNNRSYSIPGTVSVAQSGLLVQFTVEFATGGSCAYGGLYSQAGRMGRIDDGNVVCSSGEAGTFKAYEIELSFAALTARFESQTSSGCQTIGHFGGLRQ